MKSPVLEVSSCDYRNHLNINTAWKSLVASCVCLWLMLECAFSTPLSPALKCSSPLWNTFISNAKSVCPQHKTCSLSAIKHVRLQCDLYLEVSSRGYFVIKDECVRIQCEIIFGGGDMHIHVAETISSLAIKRVHLLFRSWFRTPLKRNRNQGKKFMK